MTNRIPLIVNPGAAQIQEVSSTDVLTVPGTLTANIVQTDNYQYANGQPFSGGGGSNYGNANAVAYGESGWAGNIIPATSNVYSLGNSTNQWSDLYVSNATIYMNNVPISLTGGNVLTVNGSDVVTTNTDGNTTLGNLQVVGSGIFIANGSPDTQINISPEPEGWAFLQLPNDATANTANTRLWNAAGNVEIGTGDFSNGGTSYTWIALGY